MVDSFKYSIKNSLKLASILKMNLKKRNKRVSKTLVGKITNDKSVFRLIFILLFYEKIVVRGDMSENQIEEANYLGICSLLYNL